MGSRQLHPELARGRIATHDSSAPQPEPQRLHDHDREPVTSSSLAPHGVIRVEGADLSYWLVGRGATLVVLHGGPGLGCGYLRRDLSALLADSHRLLFYDQRGSGCSTGVDDPRRLTMATLVADLEAVRRAAGLECLNLLGHSFGGLLAQYYAVAHPDRIRSLILVDSDPPRQEDWRGFRQIVAARRTGEQEREMRSIRSRVGWETDRRQVTRYLHLLFKPYFADPRDAARLDLRLGPWSAAGLLTTGPRIREDLGRWDISEQAGRLDRPVLLIYGGSTIYPETVPGIMQATFPRSRLVVLEDAGHFPFIEAQEAFVAAVRGFLRRLGGSP